MFNKNLSKTKLRSGTIAGHNQVTLPKWSPAETLQVKYDIYHKKWLKYSNFCMNKNLPQ